jgi:hypothetical protein
VLKGEDDDDDEATHTHTHGPFGGFSPAAADGRFAYGGGSTLALWDMETQHRVAKYTGHTVSHEWKRQGWYMCAL